MLWLWLAGEKAFYNGTQRERYLWGPRLDGFMQDPEKRLILVVLFLVGIDMASGIDSPIQTPVFELSLVPIRGMICLTPQGDPSSYPDQILSMSSLGTNLLNSFHGNTSNSHVFLNMTDQAGVGCIPSIPLICWIRFGDPPYPGSGPLGWLNILEWLKLYGCLWPDVLEPFNQGQNGTKALTDEQLEEQVEQTIHELGGSLTHTSLLAYYAFDEPTDSAPGVVERIARVHAAFCSLGSSRNSSLLPPP